jgi:hypothetical protein
MVDWPRQIWQHRVVFLFLSTRTVITACNWLAGRVRAPREGGAEWKTERERLTVTRYLPALRLILPSPGYSCWSTTASSTHDRSQTDVVLKDTSTPVWCPPSHPFSEDRDKVAGAWSWPLVCIQVWIPIPHTSSGMTYLSGPRLE